jgi:uncharacterized protein (DUF58 family)
MKGLFNTRPTLSAVLLFAASFSIAFILLAYNKDSWPFAFDLAFLVLAAMGLDAVLMIPASRLSISVETPARLFVGATGEVVVRVDQTGAPRPIDFGMIAEYRGEVDWPRPVVASPGVDGRTKARLTVQTRRRGSIELDAVWLRWRSPFGLMERVIRQPVSKKIDVLPDIRGIHSAGLQFFSRDAINGVKVQKQTGDGSEFEALRDHAAGLDNRHIDWKRSAKHRKLLSKEFRTERNHHIILAFDTGYLMLEPIAGISRLDHAVKSGLLLAWISLRNGDHVGSFGFDARVRQYIPPSRGLLWFTQLQRGTSRLAYHAEETNFTLGLAELNARLKRRALVVLFTEFVDTTTAELLIESLKRISNRHAVVFVTLRDPMLSQIIDTPPTEFLTVAEAVVTYDLMRDRAIVLERLERMGVHCLDVSVDGLAVGLINRYLMIKERGLI